tara:strand:- start:13995 stop:14585 length:591 start_codon:yes stop_codon:yes gene_type:complete
MLMFLLSLVYAEEDTASPWQPDLSITVKDSRYVEIYMEDPKVVCDSCNYKNDASTLFVAANRHHKPWFKNGTIHAIYNRDTVGLRYPECDFQKATYKCMQENSVWLLRSTVVINDNQASLSLLLIDDSGKVQGQSSYVKHTKTKIVNKEKEVKSIGGVVGTGFQANEKEPVVIKIQPILSDRDVDQTMIMLYDSIR